MRRWLALLVLGALATIGQGAFGSFVSAPWCPDFGLLVVVAIGLSFRSAAGGLLLAALLGYLADLLSGTLLGQHALLRVIAFGTAWIGTLHFNLVGTLPQMVFVAVLSVAHAFALGATNAFFFADQGFGIAPAGALAAHALVNALFAPPVTWAVGRLVSALGPEDANRRMLRLETGSFTS